MYKDGTRYTIKENCYLNHMHLENTWFGSHTPIRAQGTPPSKQPSKRFA